MRHEDVSRYPSGNTRRRYEIGVPQRVALGLAGSASVINVGLAFAGLSDATASRDMHYTAALRTERTLEAALPPADRRGIQSQLGRANTLLASESTGQRAGRVLTAALRAERSALGNRLSEQASRAQQEIREGEREQREGEGFGVFAVVSGVAAPLLIAGASGAFSRRPQW